MAPRHIDMETDTLKVTGMWGKQSKSSHAPWSIVQHLLKNPQKTFFTIIFKIILSFHYWAEAKCSNFSCASRTQNITIIKPICISHHKLRVTCGSGASPARPGTSSNTSSHPHSHNCCPHTITYTTTRPSNNFSSLFLGYIFIFGNSWKCFSFQHFCLHQPTYI